MITIKITDAAECERPHRIAAWRCGFSDCFACRAKGIEAAAKALLDDVYCNSTASPKFGTLLRALDEAIKS